jgi:putative ABC transport system permease protein
MLLADTMLALSALMRNKMRSLLTILGIVIGVAAVVMMQSMGRGATAYVGEAISGLGSNMLFALPGAQRTFGPVSMGVPRATSTRSARRHTMWPSWPRRGSVKCVSCAAATIDRSMSAE